MEKTPQSLFQIRFQDCDPFRHLNNARFIDYCFNAREDHLRDHYQLDMQEHIRTFGNAWLVVSNQITYMKPANVGEKVMISTQLIDWSDKTVTAEMIMWNEAKTQIKCLLWARFAYFSVTSGKSVEHSDDLKHLFREVCLPVSTTSFEERSLELGKLMREGVGN